MSSVGVGSFEQFLASFDADPQVRGKQFEKTVKWLLLNDPKYKRKYKNVWLWSEFPERTGPDIGIDVVAQGHDNSLCAIQAKCFDSGRDIPKSEIDSFISAASPRKYAHRMLVATTDGLSVNARKTLQDNQVEHVLKSYLESLESFWPKTFSSLGAPRTISKYVPRTHQTQAINDVSAGLQTVSRGQLIMACGTGKTLTALWITEHLDSSCTLVLVPSLSLLSQTLSEWTTHANKDWDYICVCSDETVNKNDDSIVTSVNEIPAVTTKPADIAKFLKTRGQKIVFSTYQSSAQVAKAQKLAGKKFDLTIADEAHRLTGKNDAEFATVLDPKKIPTKKLLFMTATPRTYSTAMRKIASDRGVEISSMDDEKVFGKELHKLSFGQAIEQDLLTDYRVVIVGVTDPQVQELIEKRELVSVGGKVETDARTLAAHIGLAKAVKDYDLKKTISFHGRIKTAQAFAKDFPKIVEWMPDDHKPSGTFWADTITGAMNSSERRILLDKLKANTPNQHSLLSNARCLTEGIDVPALDAVAFIDPRSSQVDIIQAVGRAIRKSKKKTLGTIVLPVLIPHEVDAETAVEDSAFKPIWAIINALKSHDQELSDSLDSLRTDLGRLGKVGELPMKIIQDLPLDIDLLIPNFTNNLKLAVLEGTTTGWDFYFGLLQKAERQLGTTRLSAVYKFEGRPLGIWVHAQRRARKGMKGWGILSPDRVSKLEAFRDWTWDAYDFEWEEAFGLLAEYAKATGTTRMSKGQKIGKRAVESWCTRQRIDFAHGNLSPDHIRRLAELPRWSWDPKLDDWESVYSALLDFQKENGHLKIPKNHALEDGRLLFSWVSNQRSHYKNGKLPADRVAKLKVVPGWVWDFYSEEWRSNLNDVRAYIDHHGSLPTKETRGMRGTDLGHWIETNRKYWRNNKLDDDQLRALEALPGWTWVPASDKDNEWFSELEAYRKANGHLKVPYDYVTPSGLRLGNWVGQKRTRYRTKKLSKDWIDRLSSLEGWIWAAREDLDAQWEHAFQILLRVAKKQGHCVFPGSLQVDGVRLGTWAQGQRRAGRDDRLSKDKRQRLEQAVGWEWSTKSTAYKLRTKSVPKGHRNR